MTAVIYEFRSRSSNALAFAAAFAKSFAIAFWTTFVWTIKVSMAVIAVIVGVATMLIAVAWLCCPDVAFVPLRDLILHSMRKPPRPTGALVLARFAVLMAAGLASAIIDYSARFIGVWWNTIVRRKPTAAQIEANCREAVDALARERAALAEATDAADALQAEKEDFALILASPVVRRAILNAWHPDKATTDEERLAFAEIFKVADRIFKTLAGEEV